MCGRFTLVSSIAEIADYFGLHPIDKAPQYNVAPTQFVCCIRQRNEQYEFCELRWGLVPPWMKKEDIHSKFINARIETVDKLPLFKNAFRLRRCLILADGFYEWKKSIHGKQPYYIQIKNQRIMAFAGIWERWDKKNEEPIESCSMIVTQAGQVLEGIHDRMPVVVQPENYKNWLDPNINNPLQLKRYLIPYSQLEFTFYPVSYQVNNPQNDAPTCTLPLKKTRAQQ